MNLRPITPREKESIDIEAFAKLLCAKGWYWHKPHFWKRNPLPGRTDGRVCFTGGPILGRSIDIDMGEHQVSITCGRDIEAINLELTLRIVDTLTDLVDEEKP